jgi:hypothetical protein
MDAPFSPVALAHHAARAAIGSPRSTTGTIGTIVD